MLKMFRENDSPHTKEWELATKFPEVATKDPERNKEEPTESIRELEAMLISRLSLSLSLFRS